MKRPDLSHGLVHLTRERLDEIVVGDSPDDIDINYCEVAAFDVLKEILRSGMLRGSGNAGFVKGRSRAVCLSEIPLSSVHQFASPPMQEKARYRFYGLTLSKRAVFQAGGRPVIYLPDSEASWLPEDQRWRHVRFEYDSVDYTHEREWRVLGNLDLTTMPGIYVLVWSAVEAKEIYESNCLLKSLIRGVLPMEHLTQVL